MTADTPISKTPFLCSNRGQTPFEHVYLMIRRRPLMGPGPRSKRKPQRGRGGEAEGEEPGKSRQVQPRTPSDPQTPGSVTVPSPSRTYAVSRLTPPEHKGGPFLGSEPNPRSSPSPRPRVARGDRRILGAETAAAGLLEGEQLTTPRARSLVRRWQGLRGSRRQQPFRVHLSLPLPHFPSSSHWKCHPEVKKVLDTQTSGCRLSFSSCCDSSNFFRAICSPHSPCLSPPRASLWPGVPRACGSHTKAIFKPDPELPQQAEGTPRHRGCKIPQVLEKMDAPTPSPAERGEGKGL